MSPGKQKDMETKAHHCSETLLVRNPPIFNESSRFFAKRMTQAEVIQRSTKQSAAEQSLRACTNGFAPLL
jgi:hypothetical protein